LISDSCILTLDWGVASVPASSSLGSFPLEEAVCGSLWTAISVFVFVCPRMKLGAPLSMCHGPPLPVRQRVASHHFVYENENPP
jgi:hypothetical protein